MDKELVDNIKRMHLFLSDRAMTVGMLPEELSPVVMSRLEFEYKFLPRLVRVRIRLTLIFWMVKKGHAFY